MVKHSSLIDLSSRVALVTGSSRGIGRDIAEALLESGARVMISGRDESILARTVEELSASYGPSAVVGQRCDITVREDVEELIAETLSTFGQLDILVCNAGGNRHIGPILDVGDAGFDQTMAVNVRSNIWLCQLAAPHLVKSGAGSILFNASAAAFTASNVLATYGISKLALLGLMRQLAFELGPKGVNVNAVCPSVVRTDFSKIMWQNEASVTLANTRIPMGRLGETNDLKGITALLVSEAGRYINGQAISVCGGEFSWR